MTNGPPAMAARFSLRADYSHALALLRLSGRPQGCDATAECLWFFGEQTAGQPRCRLQMRGAARVDHRSQPRAPRRQRLVWPSEVAEHRQILAGAELVAQALSFLRPHLSEPRPQRLDQI